MTRWIHLALLVASLLLACAIAIADDPYSIERRLATLEEQHLNVDRYNASFDLRTEAHFKLIEQAQAAQDLELKSLHDTQNILLFIASLSPMALSTYLSWFYWQKGRDAARRKARAEAASKT